MLAKTPALSVMMFLCLADPSLAEDRPAAAQGSHWGGSLVNYIMNLPEVVQWSEYEKSKNPEAEITAWGERMGQVDGKDCAYMGLGLTLNDKVKTLKHFCVSKEGELWIQKAENPDSDEIPAYIHYDDWVSQCSPEPYSYGKC